MLLELFMNVTLFTIICAIYMYIVLLFEEIKEFKNLKNVVIEVFSK